MKTKKELEAVRAELEKKFLELQLEVEELKKDGQLNLEPISRRIRKNIRRLRQLLKETT